MSLSPQQDSFARRSAHLGRPPELEQILKPGAPAILITPNQEIEGTIVHYNAASILAIEITIESRHSG
jgi:hypothetical protein